MFERHFFDISKFDRAGFLTFALVFVSRDFELGRNLSGDFRKSLTYYLVSGNLGLFERHFADN